MRRVAVSEEVFAYGNPSNPTIGTPFQYQGAWSSYTDSETGLVLQGRRFYDPATGGWLTRDPIGYAGGINLYAYVGDDPVDFSDEDGLRKERRRILREYWDDLRKDLSGDWELVTSYSVSTVRKISEIWSEKMVSLNKWIDVVDTSITNANMCQNFKDIFSHVYETREMKKQYQKWYLQQDENVQIEDIENEQYIRIKKRDHKDLFRTRDLAKEASDSTFQSLGTVPN